MFFYLKSTKNHRMISQLCYKQKSKTFRVGTNKLFCFDQALWFNFKNLAKCFRKFFINKITSGVVQVLAKVVALVLFPSVNCIMKRLSQKRSFGMKDEEIIRLFSSSLERATLFPNQYSQCRLYLKHL